MISIVSLVMCLILHGVTLIAAIPVEYSCDLIFRHVKDYGLSIFAGRDYFTHEENSVSTGMLIPISTYENTELYNYASGWNETHASIEFGYSMLYNHGYSGSSDAQMLRRTLYPASSFQYPTSGRYSHDLVFSTRQDVRKGQQLFSFYGSKWFEYREAIELNPCQQNPLICDYNTSLDGNSYDIIRVPGCPQSLIEMKGRKLYAKRKLFRGEYIDVSRALLLPLDDVLQKGDIDDIVWYKDILLDEIDDKECHVVQGQYAVLVLSRLALAAGDTEEYNIDYHWWDYDTYANYAKSNDITLEYPDGSIDSFVQFAYDENGLQFPHPTQCDSRMWISFIANRDIEMGEELTLNLSYSEGTNRRLVYEGFGDACL